MVLKLCCRCGQPTPNRPAVCDNCKATAPAAKREATRYYDAKLRDKRADAFYHSPEWKTSRMSYLLSVGCLCEDCVAEFVRGERKEEDVQLATDVHHEEPIAVNWNRRLDPRNYRALCDYHHKKKRCKR